MSDDIECVVVGGGAAGLSAALVLGRARRRTVVVDAGAQCNLAAAGIGGLLGSDGVPPADFYARGRAELDRYPSVEIRIGEVVAARRQEGGFRLELDNGAVVAAPRILLATGMHYDLPDVPGIAPLWGDSVFHCPFCHGWEVRDQPVAVLADGDRGAHLALLLSGWSDDVVLLTSGPSVLDGRGRARLTAAGVLVDEREVTGLESDAGHLSAVAFADGSQLPRRGLLVGVTLRQRSDLAARLGVTFAAPGPVSAEAIEVDAMSRASVAGVFAAGDVCVQRPQLTAAITSGSAAAAAVVADILEGGA